MNRTVRILGFIIFCTILPYFIGTLTNLTLIWYEYWFIGIVLQSMVLIIMGFFIAVYNSLIN